MAYVMGYGLGLSDHGRVSRCESEALIDTVMPSASMRLPLYRNTRFWLMVCLVTTATLSLAGAAEFEQPEYATLSAPLAHPAAPPIVENAHAAAGSIDAKLHTLRGLDTKRASALATQLLATATESDRIRILDAMSHRKGDSSGQVLVAALADNSTRVVEAALGALVGRGDAQAVPKISHLLTHRTAEVRRLAADALGVLASPKDAAELVDLLNDNDKRVRIAARRALTQIVGRDLGSDKGPWKRHLSRHASR